MQSVHKRWGDAGILCVPQFTSQCCPIREERQFHVLCSFRQMSREKATVSGTRRRVLVLFQAPALVPEASPRVPRRHCACEQIGDRSVGSSRTGLLPSSEVPEYISVCGWTQGTCFGYSGKVYQILNKFLDIFATTGSTAFMG